MYQENHILIYACASGDKLLSEIVNCLAKLLPSTGFT